MLRSSPCLPLTGAALLLALGCSSAGTRSVRPERLFHTELTASRVSHEKAVLPTDATTFAIAPAPGSNLPAEVGPLVISLLERRGWSPAEPGANADLQVTLGDGSSTSRAVAYQGGSPPPLASQMQYGLSTPSGGDTLNRTIGGCCRATAPLPSYGSTVHQHRLAIGLEAGGAVAWHGFAWDESHDDEVLAAASRLAAALADHLPAPAKPSAERAAVDALGADYLIFRSFAGPLRPAVLSVAPASAVARAGWQPRDVLASIGGADTADLTWNEVAARLTKARSEPVRVELLRAGERYLTFLVPEGPQHIHCNSEGGAA